MTTLTDVSASPGRDVLVFSNPALWPCWPFLPVMRRTKGVEELGLMYDVRHITGRTGYSATIFKCNLFELPPTEAEFLALPREVFDTCEEVAAGGWRVD